MSHTASEAGQSTPELPFESPRRSFLTQALAVIFGLVTGLVPVAVGVATFLNPLRKAKKGGSGDGFIKVTELESLPYNVPQLVNIIADRHDAWNYYPKEPIGSVYITKTGPQEVQVFNTTCPHAGCAVDYQAEKNCFFCPCHNSKFALDGKRDATSPSARDLDTLELRVDDKGDVWVKYQDFQPGHPGKDVV